MPARVARLHDARRSAILGCAERLFASAGYEATTVGAIIGEAGIAKGTFYHYFAAKEELLDALVEQLADRVRAAMAPILDGSAPTADKLRRILETAGAITRAWGPGSLLARHKLSERTIATAATACARIIRQGNDEGSFDAAWPEETAELLLRVWAALAGGPGERLLSVYQLAAERLLGARRGSLRLGEALLRFAEEGRRTLESGETGGRP